MYVKLFLLSFCCIVNRQLCSQREESMDQTSPFHPRTASADSSFPTGTLGARVAEQLLNKIRLDDLQPGARLPSEQAMAQHFGVSRTVVREAIALLKAEGLLETRKGSGAFV